MTEDRISTSLRSLCALLLLAGCDGAAQTREVSFQVAGAAGGSCDVIRQVPNPCITVVAYEHGTRNQLPLVRADDESRTEYFKLRFEGATVTPRWDVRVEEGQRVDVQVLVYENDGAARFGALLEDVGSEEDVAVRLYPFREWACPGTAAAPRALHGAVALDEHRVLIFGGVQGEMLDPLSARDPRAHGGARLVNTIELYDGRTHTFQQLEIQGIDGATFFRRVLFDSFLVGENTVRVVGGFTGDAGTPILHFDNLGTRAITTFGSPFLPSMNAVPAFSVDLVVDAAMGAVRIEDASAGIIPRGGLIDVSAFFGSGAVTDPALVTLGIAPMGMEFNPPQELYEITREGAAGNVRRLANVRMGASTHPYDDGFVAWGGNVNHMTGDAASSAAEFLDRGTSDGVIVPAVGVPAPTAFHTATSLGEGRSLMAGGFRVEDDGFVYNGDPSVPLWYLTVGVGPSFEVATVPTPPTHVPSIFHTASVVPGQGVALLGGAGVDPPGSTFGSGNRLAPLAQAVFVNGAAYTPIQALSTPRWGHTATVLSGHRLLVVGGFSRDPGAVATTFLEAIQSAELFYWDEAPPDLQRAECDNNMPEREDAGPEGMDGGVPPRFDAGTDAGMPVDAGIDGEAGTVSEAGVDAG